MANCLLFSNFSKRNKSANIADYIFHSAPEVSELWDPGTGPKSGLTQCSLKKGSTTAPISFCNLQCVFSVFNKQENLYRYPVAFRSDVFEIKEEKMKEESLGYFIGYSCLQSSALPGLVQINLINHKNEETIH